jgi:hypothetical protein
MDSGSECHFANAVDEVLRLQSSRKAAWGHERRFVQVTSTSASASTPDIFRRRSERSKRAISGLMHRSRTGRYSITSPAFASSGRGEAEKP